MNDDTLQRNANAFPLFVFHSRLLRASFEIRREDFFLCQIAERFAKMRRSKCRRAENAANIRGRRESHMLKQCSVIDVQEEPTTGNITGYFRFVYDGDAERLPLEAKLQYQLDTWLKWTFDPGSGRAWEVPLLIACWQSKAPITCDIDEQAGAVVGINLTFVPINNN